MPPRKGRSSGKYRTGRKYHRGYYVGRGYSRRNGALGFFGALFFLVMGLILFGNEDEKKIGWGTIAGIFILCLIASAGSAAPIIIVLIIVAGIALLSGLSVKNGTCHPPVNVEEPEETVILTTDKKNTTVKRMDVPRTTSSLPENSYRYEERKHESKNKTPITVKTVVKPVEEQVKSSADPIETKDSGLVKGLTIGEMEWTHMEKGEIIEEKIPKQEFFESIADAKAEYDIPDDYIRIMIEINSDGSVRECPALVWKDNFFLNILPLIKKSTISCWSLKKFKEVSYKVLPEVDPDCRYNGIGMAALASEFEDRFPEYMFNGEYGTYTGVFVFPEGIEITNTSAKSMFELLEPEFTLDDAVTSSDKYEPEIKEIYKNQILWKNNVIDAGKYKELKNKHFQMLKERECSEKIVLEQIELAKEFDVFLE